MTQRYAIDAVVAELIDRAPAEARDTTALELIGAAAAHLEGSVGAQAAAAALYGLADAIATGGARVAGGGRG